MHKIKVIIFDLGRVLLPVDTEYLVMRASELLDIPQEIINEAWKKYRADLTLGKRSVADLYAQIADEQGIQLKLPSEQVVRELYTYFEDAQISDEMLVLIKQLQKHYIVTVLSNTEVETGQIFSQGMIASTVGHVYASAQLGMKKPEREIYDHVCDDLGVISQACLFIDDLDENVLGAQKAGMQAVVFTDYEALVRYLKKENIIEIK